MKKIMLLCAAAIVMLLAVLAGCAVTVRTPPPAVQVEAHPAVPFRGAVWVDGYYAHRHGKYAWVPGRYVKPPRAGAAWVPGHWKQYSRGWKWTPGYWR